PARVKRSWVGWLVPAIGLAAIVVVTVLTFGRLTRSTPSSIPSTPAAAPPATASRHEAGNGRERVLLTAAEDHLEQAEMLLVELMNAPERPNPDFRFERETADDLVFSSRLYRQTAEQNGDVRLANMLEDLESVFVEVARSPDKIDRRDLDSLRARIGGDSLLFKVRAASNDIRERQNRLIVSE